MFIKLDLTYYFSITGTEEPELQSLRLSNKVQSYRNKSWRLDKKILVDFRVSSIAISPKENKIAIRSSNPFVAIWDLSEYQYLASINKKYKNFIMNFDNLLNFDKDKAVAFSPDGTIIAFSVIQTRDSNNLLLYNVKTLLEENIVTEHKDNQSGRIRSVAFSRDGKLLASASQDSTVKLWQVNTKKQYGSLPHQNPVYTVSFSPDGSTLASGDSKGYVKFWDIRSKNELGFIHSEEWSSINSIDFNSDGSILAVGGDGDLTNGNHLELWNVNTKEVIHSLTEHNDPVNSVAFSPDGQTLASGSDDGSVKLWDVKSGKKLLTLSDDDGSSDKVTSVAFSSDGQTLVSSSEDRIVKIWRC